jgi:hypothetical protein
MSRSRSTTDRIPGRCTFTTTSAPDRSRAACTWATEAAASGSRSNQANTSSTCPPRSARSTCSTCGHGAGAARSCNRLSSSVNSGGRRSGRVDKIWPSLTKVTPPSSSALRTDRASSSLASGVSSSARRRPRRYGLRPLRIAIRLIWEHRRVRASRPRNSRRHAIGPGSDPVGTSASAITRNTMATTKADAEVSTRNHAGVTAPSVVGTAPRTALAMGPTTANASRPAASSRTTRTACPAAVERGARTRRRSRRRSAR